MTNNKSDRIGLLLFFLSLVVVAVVYGNVAVWRAWFPAPQLEMAQRTLADVIHNWKNDLGLEPSRHLVAPGGRNTGPYRGEIGQLSTEGYVLMAGLNENQDESFHVVRLYDQQGDEVHHWPVHYEWLDTEKKPQNVMLHGMEVLEDGSLILTFDEGRVIARIDVCGQPMWAQRGVYHHSVARDGQGHAVTLLDDGIAWLDENTGQVVRRLDIIKDMTTVDDGAQKAMLDIRTRTPDDVTQPISYLPDTFHPNDAEPLRPEMAYAFPMFEAGDILFSLRELNLVTVVDPDTGRMKWWKYGPWFKQHDPDFESDGTITVFDNATGSGKSRILSVRPGDDRVKTRFVGSEEVPFYSWRRGKHQTLDNGNYLITEAEGGRVLEVSRAGSLVWEKHRVWDEEHNLITTEARFVALDFFAGGTPRCG